MTKEHLEKSLDDALDEIVALKHQVQGVEKTKAAITDLNEKLLESEKAWRELALKRGEEVEALKKRIESLQKCLDAANLGWI